jgi:hypothetical protein
MQPTDTTEKPTNPPLLEAKIMDIIAEGDDASYDEICASIESQKSESLKMAAWLLYDMQPFLVTSQYIDDIAWSDTKLNRVKELSKYRHSITEYISDADTCDVIQFWAGAEMLSHKMGMSRKILDMLKRSSCSEAAVLLAAKDMDGPMATLSSEDEDVEYAIDLWVGDIAVQVKQAPYESSVVIGAEEQLTEEHLGVCKSRFDRHSMETNHQRFRQKLQEYSVRSNRVRLDGVVIYLAKADFDPSTGKPSSYLSEKIINRFVGTTL